MKRLCQWIVVLAAVAAIGKAPHAQSRAAIGQSVSDRTAAGEELSVIVGVDASFVPEGALDSDAVAIQREGIARALGDVMSRASDAGIVTGSSFETMPFFTARVNRASLAALAAMPGVVSVVENEMMRVNLASSLPVQNVPAAHAAGFTGTGWAVAIMDTGVDKTHPFLAGKVVSEACYSNAGGTGTGTTVCPGGVTASTAVGSGVPCNAGADCQHGTHVAGIAAGANGPGSAPKGVAPGASVIAVQVFTRFDSTSVCGTAPGDVPCASAYVSDLVLGLNRVNALAGAGNVNHVAAVNMSLGGSTQYSTQAACDVDNSANGRKAAIDNLLSNGIASVISSGNNSARTTMSSPACISTAVSVGSITDALQVSSFSNNAPFLSLYGVGSDVTSSVPGGGYASFQGTSMAAPHVAGAWAVIKQAVPAATPQQVLTALQATGTSINDQRSSGGGPHPLINVNNARLALLGVGGSAPGAPTTFQASASGNTVLTTWGVPASGGAPTGYTLLVRLVSGGPIVYSAPVGNLLSFSIPGAPNGTFILSVVATNGAGTGPESNAVAVTVPNVGPPPGNPTNLQRTVNGSSATFTWSAPSSGGPVAEYVFIAGQTSGFPSPLATVVLPGSQTGVQIDGIPAGTWYVRVYARNAAGNSALATNEVQVIVAGPQPPAAPTLNTPVVAGNTVTLSWTAGGGGAPTSYTLIVALSPGGTPILTAPLTGTGVSFPGVPSGTYYLKLVANNALGSSPASNEVVAAVP